MATLNRTIRPVGGDGWLRHDIHSVWLLIASECQRVLINSFNLCDQGRNNERIFYRPSPTISTHTLTAACQRTNAFMGTVLLEVLIKSYIIRLAPPLFCTTSSIGINNNSNYNYLSAIVQ